MPIELPSNVTPLWEGSITVRIFRDRLWPDLPAASDGEVNLADVDPIASSIKFARLWQDELQRRQKRSRLRFTTEPGSFQTQVDVGVNHANPRAMEDTLAVGMSVYGRWKEWVVLVGTPEARDIRAAYQANRTEQQPEEPPDHEF
jgi:hypothetical protein